MAALIVFTGSGCGQTSRGTVAGTVLDPSGATIPRVQVMLTGKDTGIRLSTDSNEAGVYRFDAVDPGTYDLEAMRDGFRKYLATGIGVQANRTTTVDPRLELGAAGTQVEVNGASSELLTKEGPFRGGNFQSREVRDLPLIPSNPVSLARVLPGATEAAGSTIWRGGYTSGGGGSINANGGGFSTNGQLPEAITICLTASTTTRPF